MTVVAADRARFEAMFEYNALPLSPSDPTDVVVFGRHDSLLADEMGHLARDGLVGQFAISGGFGKDSGELWDLKIPEAQFVGEFALQAYPEDIEPDDISYDFKALTGDDNARNGLRLLMGAGRRLTEVTALGHATSLRRLAGTLSVEAQALDTGTKVVYRVPTRYQFDPYNINDQKEVAAETLRLAYWPEHGWLEAQDDLPLQLVDFAHSVVADVPTRPTTVQKFVIGHLPHRLKRMYMDPGFKDRR